MPTPKFKLTPAVLKKITHYASVGLGYKDIAAMLGVHYKTLMKHKKINPDIEASYKVGRANMKDSLLNRAMDMAMDKKHKDSTTNTWKLLERLDRESTDVDGSTGDSIKDDKSILAEITLELK